TVLPHQMPELGDHPAVAVALEADHAVDAAVEVAPFPAREFRLMKGVEVDLGVLAGEAHGEPDLLLALEIAADLLLRQDIGRKVVDDPVPRAADDRNRGEAGFFLQFAPRGNLQVLAFVDPALRELPGVIAGDAGAVADPYLVLGIEHHNADIRPVPHRAGIGFICHWCIIAEAGASCIPLPSSDPAHFTATARVTGKAMPVPNAWPRDLAVVSSPVSWANMAWALTWASTTRSALARAQAPGTSRAWPSSIKPTPRAFSVDKKVLKPALSLKKAAP